MVPFFPDGRPLIRTVPGLPGFRLCGVEVVTVTVPDVLLADAIAMRACAATCCKSTADRFPPPPGVTYARSTRGSTAICGFEPVLRVTEAIGQYLGVEAGGCPGKHTEAGCVGSRFTINPTFVEAKATIPRCVWESTPTEYGNGGA